MGKSEYRAANQPGARRVAGGCVWRAVSEWPETQRPPAPWAWLCHPGSLTRKLRGVAGASFHVDVLNEAEVTLDADDAALLGVAAGTRARLREVYLSGTLPLVFGRTLAPPGLAADWLTQLGDQPLGDRVFAEADALRGGIEVAQVQAGDAFYRDAVRALPAPPSSLWVRRSVLQVQAARLLIYEAFFPGVDQ